MTPELPAIGAEVPQGGVLPPIGAEVSATVGANLPAQSVATDTRSATERFLAPILPSTTPADYVNGPLYAMRHPIDSAKLIAGAIKSDPVGAIPVVGNVKRGIQDIGSGNYAGAAGEAVMALAPLALEGVRNPVGRATAATGGALERVATSPKVEQLSGLGAAGEAVLKGNYGYAAGALMIPTAAEYLGKGLRTLGELLQSDGSLNSQEIGALRVKLIDPRLANNAPALAAIRQAIKVRGGKP